MHEYSVMSQMVSALLDELKARNIDRVKSVNLEIGELTFLNPDSLAFAFEVLIKGTPLHGAVLDTLEIRSEVECGDCGYRGPVDYHEDGGFHPQVPLITCPECGSKPGIVKGRETVIKSITVVDEDDGC